MQYSRPMIDLIMELRRRVEADMKPSVKLANPEVLNELASYYFKAKDTITKTLIKELLSLAGEEWLALLNPKTEPATQPHKTVKVYRGQTMLVDAPVAPDSNSETKAEALSQPAAPVKHQRMYRGQPVL